MLLNDHFVPDNPGVSAGVTHLVGIVTLWIMLCGHSVTISGCSIDGESPAEEACLLPNYYVRLFWPVKTRKSKSSSGVVLVSMIEVTD